MFMKRNLSLLSIESNVLDANESHSIVGGNTCGCACAYANKGGSSIADNSDANKAGNQVSRGYRLQDCKEITIGDQTW